MAEPPYGEIADLLRSGLVVPFLGAGASMVGRPPDGKWNPANPEFLPSGADLAHFLADKSSFPTGDPRDCDDLAKVSAYYADMLGRPRLRRRLRDVLTVASRVGLLHELLAAAPMPLLLVVTNYDTLLEQAFRDAGRPYDLVVHPTDHDDRAGSVLWWPHGATEPKFEAPQTLDVDLDRTTVIYKMHGTVLGDTDRWDSFVITEDDYVDFLYRMTSNTAVPAIFYEHFRERSFLFLGYGLRDWNLRLVLKTISKSLATRHKVGRDSDDPPPPSWAIQLSPSELERTLWNKRSVHIFDVPLDDFAGRLRQRMTV